VPEPARVCAWVEGPAPGTKISFALRQVSSSTSEVQSACGGYKPREAVAAPSLALFKARLDGALSNLGWWKMSLLMAGGLELDDL